jgi:hypothetical protein
MHALRMLRERLIFMLIAPFGFGKRNVRVIGRASSLSFAARVPDCRFQ